MKNTSSNRPLRISSAGRAETSLAVAIIKIGWRWSCIQDSSVPNMRFDSPPSADASEADANAFSISSIQRTTGAIASACVSAFRSWLSLSPMYF